MRIIPAHSSNETIGNMQHPFMSPQIWWTFQESQKEQSNLSPVLLFLRELLLLGFSQTGLDTLSLHATL